MTNQQIELCRLHICTSAHLQWPNSFCFHTEHWPLSVRNSTNSLPVKNLHFWTGQWISFSYTSEPRPLSLLLNSTNTFSHSISWMYNSHSGITQFLRLASFGTFVLQETFIMSPESNDNSDQMHSDSSYLLEWAFIDCCGHSASQLCDKIF